jgi:hypothetical protein
MPSTGTTNYTMTAQQMVNTVAAGPLRIVIEGASPSTAFTTNALNEMNIILKSYPSSGLKLWAYTTTAVPMVANQNSYTLGPTGSGANVITPYIERVFETGNYIRYFPSGGQPYDTPLNLLSRAEYKQFGTKSSTGVPNSIYYDRKITTTGGTTSAATGYGTLFVYVAPSDSTRTIYLNAQRQIFDVTSTTDEIDIPSNWFIALKWQLALAMTDYVEVPEDRLSRIFKMSQMYQVEANDFEEEEAPMSLAPDLRGLRRYR